MVEKNKKKRAASLLACRSDMFCKSFQTRLLNANVYNTL